MALNTDIGSAEATSYATLAFIRAFATARGITLPSDDAKAEQLAISAMDWLESNEAELKGERANPGVQALAFPRVGITLYGAELPSDAIPPGIQQAQARAVCEIMSGVDLMPTTSGPVLKRKKTGPLEKEYDTTARVTPTTPKLDALIKPFLRNGGTFLKTVRV